VLVNYQFYSWPCRIFDFYFLFYGTDDAPLSEINILVLTNCGHGRPQGGQNGHYPPLEIGTKKENFLENVKSAVQFRLVGLVLVMTVFFFRYDTHTAQESGSLFWYHTVMSLPFTKFSLPAEAGCETRERIVLLLAFVA